MPTWSDDSSVLAGRTLTPGARGWRSIRSLLMVPASALGRARTIDLDAAGARLLRDLRSRAHHGTPRSRK